MDFNLEYKRFVRKHFVVYKKKPRRVTRRLPKDKHNNTTLADPKERREVLRHEPASIAGNIIPNNEGQCCKTYDNTTERKYRLQQALLIQEYTFGALTEKTQLLLTLLRMRAKHFDT